MTQNQISENLWVGDDQYNGEDYEYIVDLREWDAERTFAEEDYQFIDGVLLDVHQFRQAGKTLVHCHGGMDRSPFICAMYLHVYHRLLPRQAYEAVKKRRPQTIIHDDWMKEYLSILKRESKTDV